MEKIDNIVYYHEKLKAVEAFLNDTEELFYRKVCRWYSQTFNTELLKVRNLSFSHILQEYYEFHFEGYEFNEILDEALNLLPKFIKEREQDDEAFAKSLENMQKQSLIKALERAKKGEMRSKKIEKIILSKEKEILKYQSLNNNVNSVPKIHKPPAQIEDQAPNPIEPIDLTFEDDGDPDTE